MNVCFGVIVWNVLLWAIIKIFHLFADDNSDDGGDDVYGGTADDAMMTATPQQSLDQTDPSSLQLSPIAKHHDSFGKASVKVHLHFWDVILLLFWFYAATVLMRCLLLLTGRLRDESVLRERYAATIHANCQQQKYSTRLFAKSLSIYCIVLVCAFVFKRGIFAHVKYVGFTYSDGESQRAVFTCPEFGLRS